MKTLKKQANPPIAAAAPTAPFGSGGSAAHPPLFSGGKSGKKDVFSTLKSLTNYFHNHIQALNTSKIFTGMMIITLNIASKFVNIKLSKTMESYLKYSFSRQILVFAMAWIGTRDIYTAFFITLLFVVLSEYLLNEDSPYNILSSEFRNYHLSKMEAMENISDEEVNKAKAVLEKAEKQKKEKEGDEGGAKSNAAGSSGVVGGGTGV
jgi:hypothetical protein